MVEPINAGWPDKTVLKDRRHRISGSGEWATHVTPYNMGQTL